MLNSGPGASGAIKWFLQKPEEDIANRKLQISLCGTGASLQFQMRDLTSQRAAHHIKT